MKSAGAIAIDGNEERSGAPGGSRMEKYLNKYIKEIITELPEIGDVLNEYDIGCVPCGVGACLLKDVVEFHYLPEDRKRELMWKIGKVIDPDGVFEMPEPEKSAPRAAPGKIKYSPPMQQLVDEHVLIKRWIALIPAIIEKPDVESESFRKLILDGVDFIRSYADKFHHAKEEEILFKHFDENLDIIKVMREDHETGRNHVKAILEALEERDGKKLAEHLNGYRELLTEHIKKEDEILYPWMDRQLSTRQVGELFGEFHKADGLFEKDAPDKHVKFVEELEKQKTK